jgi:hypothetical protein
MHMLNSVPYGLARKIIFEMNGSNKWLTIWVQCLQLQTYLEHGRNQRQESL